MSDKKQPDAGTAEASTMALPAGHTLSLEPLDADPYSTFQHDPPDAPSDPRLSDGPFLPPTPTLPGSPDRMLGRYRDLGTVGSGGMGEVRRIFDPHLQRTLVMKIIHPHLMDQPVPAGRFMMEARIQAGLQHAAIVPVHEIDRLPDGRQYFTMKEISGRTLADRIRDAHHADDAPLNEDRLKELLQIFVLVSRAVAYAHSLGVIHRDLKPENVMVGEFGEVQIVDWGLATVVEGTFGGIKARSHFEPGVAGTPAYMSPEQACGSPSALSPRSDIYSLGAILYELLSGRPPFEGASAMEVLSLAIHTEPAPIERAAGGALPESLVATCTKAMARDPGARPSDARWLANEVADWLSGAQARQRANAVVDGAMAMLSEASRLDAKSEALWSTDVRPDAPETAWPAWSALKADLDKRESLRADATARFEGALGHEPGNPRAHAALARHHHARLVEARRERRLHLASAHEARVRNHLSLLDSTAATALGNQFDRQEQDVQAARNLLQGAFVGRVGMLRRLEQWWSAPPSPGILALVGLAGVGKSRLSLAFAERLHRSGTRAVYCSLAGCTPGHLLVEEVRRALRLPQRNAGIDGLKEELLAEPILLILDQVDSVLDAACHLARDIRGVAPTARVLLTTRKRPDEADILIEEVPPLTPLESAMLLRRRIVEAGGAEPGGQFGPVMQLLEYALVLGRVPLALELAAPRLAVNNLGANPQPVLSNIDAGEDSTLDAVLSWSWNQLSPAEQAALTGLAILALPLPGQVAEVALAASGGNPRMLGTLLDSGLVASGNTDDDKSLYEVPPHVREFMDRQAIPSERVSSVAVIDAVATHLAESDVVRSILDPGDVLQDNLPSTEMTNLLTAASIRSTTPAGVRCGLAALFCLSRYGSSADGLNFAERLLQHPDLSEDDALNVDFQRLPMLRGTGRVDDALALIEQIEQRMKRRGAKTNAPDRDHARLEALALQERGLAAREEGDLETALDCLKRASALFGRHGWTAEARSVGSSTLDLYRVSSRIEEGLDAALQWQMDELQHLEASDLSATLHDLAASLRDASRYGEALQFIQVARAAAERASSERHKAMCIALEASIHDEQGRWAAAMPLYREAVRVHQRMGNARSMAISMTNLGAALCNSGDPGSGMAILRRAASLHSAAGRPRSHAIALGLLGTELRRQGNMLEAEDHLHRAIDMARATIPYAAAAFSGELALVESDRGNHSAALRRVSSAETFLHDHPDELGRLYCKRATVELAAGQPDEASHSLERAIRIASRLRLGPQTPMRQAIAELAPRFPHLGTDLDFSYTTQGDLQSLADAGEFRELVNTSAVDLAAAEADSDLVRIFEHAWWLLEGRMGRGHLGSARFLSDTLRSREATERPKEPHHVASLRFAIQRMRLDIRSGRAKDALTTETRLKRSVERHPQVRLEWLCVAAEARLALGRWEEVLERLHREIHGDEPLVRTSPQLHHLFARALDLAGRPFQALEAHKRAAGLCTSQEDAVVAQWRVIAAAARVGEPSPSPPPRERVQALSRMRLIAVRTLQCEAAFLTGSTDTLVDQLAALEALTHGRTPGQRKVATERFAALTRLIGDLSPDASTPAVDSPSMLETRLEETRLIAAGGKWEAALELAERLEQEASRHGDQAARGLAERNLGLLLRQCGRAEAGIPWLVRARARARLIHDSLLEARALASIGCTFMGLGRLDEAADALSDGLSITEAGRNAGESASIISDLINVEHYRGRTTEAEALARRGIVLAMNAGNRQHEAANRCGLANVLKRNGDHEGALSEWTRAAEIAREAGLHYIVNIATINQAELELDRGRTGIAEDILRDLLTSGSPMQPGERHLTELLLGTSLIEQGRADSPDVRRPTRRTISQGVETVGSSMYYLGRIHLGLGNMTEARSCLQAMDADSGHHHLPDFRQMRNDLAARLEREQ